MTVKPAYKTKLLLLVVLSLVVIVITFMSKCIPQSLSYHQFADARSIFGLLNGWNVLSNIPFYLSAATVFW